jgi:hypothetical protein
LNSQAKKNFFEKMKNFFLAMFLRWFQKKAFIWEIRNDNFNKTKIGAGHTTGYGIICEK